ncbi:rho-related GTP-binding protein RhoJ-like [Gigantopelta aegis]|uniref:rho-related GTP-binding protein RhoJ-like n=1 Tax=Gigantopelta aegis TaxID=1735272 RepID=UPI001B8891B1|nr:rho-related GTP-binding protein RhoJ-like [Gigantopelta aegis]
MRAGAMKYNKKKFVHCAILGDGMVGKTCLTLSYTQKAFMENYTATVFENYAVPLTVGGEEFVISMFDTAGQVGFESLRAYTYKESEVLLLCFSVCERQSFTSIVDLWIPEIKRHTKRRRPVILVGTQIDLRSGYEDQVSFEEGAKLSKEIGADCYIECSAQSREGLNAVFEHVIFSALKYRKKKSNIINRIFGLR